MEVLLNQFQLEIVDDYWIDENGERILYTEEEKEVIKKLATLGWFGEEFQSDFD